MENLQFRFPVMLSLPLWPAERSLKHRGGIKLKPDCSCNEREQQAAIACNLHQGLHSEEIPSRGLGQFHLWSGQFAGVHRASVLPNMQEQPKLLWKRTGQSKQVTTQKPCDSVVVGGTIFLSDWAEILSVPLTSSWIYSKPTVYHCSVYSTGMWQVLPSTSEITWLQCLPVVRQMTVFKCAAFLLDRLAA